MSRVLMIASECTPYSKTGGLADVVGALPHALSGGGDEVAVVLPLYRTSVPKAANAQRVYEGLPVAMGNANYEAAILRLADRNVSIFFVDCPPLFDRPNLYGEAGLDYPDNHIRYGVFCRAALGVVRYLFRPDILHLHDWQAALTAPYLQTLFAGDPTFYGIKTLLTIHNLGYQGLFPASALADLGLPPGLFDPEMLEFYGQINLLKGGIVFADAINTVSRAYAREIQTKEYGFGLEGLLRRRADVLTGIVNGVDYAEWNPENDRFIVERYSQDDLKGKERCKSDLLREFDLPQDSRKPLIGIVSRFVGQKGFDLIEQIGPELAQDDFMIVALGSGEPRYEEAVAGLAAAFPDRIAVRVGYNNALAHKIEAGADIFLMPSRYEPCGLNQIYSLKYGTVPVVRATGGLDDTIDESSGFKFREYTATALLDATRAALAAYKNRERWTAMMKRGMRKDFSWTASAAEYSALYRRILT